MSNSDIRTETRDVRDFDRVELRYYGDLHIRQGNEEALTVEAEPAILAQLKTEVRGRKLVLDLKGDWLERLTAGLKSLGGQPITYRLTVKELRGIEISGKGDVQMEALHTDRLALQSSGLGEIRISNVETETLDVRISGRAEVALAGTTREQSVTVSGSGEYRSAELASNAARVKISGHGNATLAANESLDVAISGVGHVTYRGDPKVSQRISGVGSVKRFGD